MKKNPLNNLIFLAAVSSALFLYGSFRYLNNFLGSVDYINLLMLVANFAALAGGNLLALRWPKVFDAPQRSLIVSGFALAVLALLFHPYYLISSAALESLLLSSVGRSLGYPLQWLNGLLLILPGSLLIGLYWALLGRAKIALSSSEINKAAGGLYFRFSSGILVGILLAGFVLIHSYGYLALMLSAGVLFALNGFRLLQLSKDPEFNESLTGGSRENVTNSTAQEESAELQFVPVKLEPLLYRLVVVLLGAVLILSATAWQRLLLIQLGDTTHNFEHFLGALVMGLGLGSLLATRLSPLFNKGALFLAGLLVLTAIAAPVSLLLYKLGFGIMSFFDGWLAKTEEGYFYYNIYTLLVSLLTMLPVTLLTGVLLTALTRLFRIKRVGRNEVSALWSLFFLGAILGAILGYQLMPVAGLKNLILIGAVLILIPGLILFINIATIKPGIRAGISIWAVLLLLISFSFTELDRNKIIIDNQLQNSRKFKDDISIKSEFNQAGWLSTVDIFEYGDFVRGVYLNGRSASSVSMRKVSTIEEKEASLAALLPFLYRPAAPRVAIMGLDTGIVSRTVQAIPSIRKVITVEGESAVIAGVHNLSPTIKTIFSDPRLEFYRESTTQFLRNRNGEFDIIILNDNTPWSGSSSAKFSSEYYRLVKRALIRTGVMSQRLSLQGITTELLSSIIKSLSENFDDYVIYATNSELIILAAVLSPIGFLESELLDFRKSNWFRAHILRLQILPTEVEIYRLGSKKIFEPFFSSYQFRPHTLLNPILENGAIRSRFFKQDGRELINLALQPVPIIEILEKRKPPQFQPNYTTQLYASEKFMAYNRARAIYNLYFGKLNDKGIDQHQNMYFTKETRQIVETVRTVHNNCRVATTENIWMPNVHWLSETLNPYLPIEDMERLWQSIASARCYKRLSSNSRRWLSLYQAISRRDPARIAQIADSILPEEVIPVSYSYPLLASMVAHAALGDYRQVIQNFQRFERRFAPDIGHKFLLAYSTEKMAEKQSQAE